MTDLNRPLAAIRSRRQAFTLIELMAVIAIMIIMSAIVIGGYFSMMSGYAIRSALNHLRGAVEIAKQKASMEGTRVYLWVTSDSDSEEYTYTTIEQAGTVTDASSYTANVVYDEFADFTSFRPDLTDPNVVTAVSRDYTKSIVYNLSRTDPTSHKRFSIVETVNAELMPRFSSNPADPIDNTGWILPLKRYYEDRAPLDLQKGDWEDGDRYGWETSPRFSLPLGFRFSDDSVVTKESIDFIYFNPDGSCGSKKGTTVNALFEIVEEYSGATCSVEVMVPSGDIEVELK